MEEKFVELIGQLMPLLEDADFTIKTHKGQKSFKIQNLVIEDARQAKKVFDIIDNFPSVECEIDRLDMTIYPL